MPENSYTKTLMLDFKVNMRDAEREIGRLGDAIDKEVGTKAVEALREAKTKQAALAHIKKEIEQFSSIAGDEAEKIVEQLKQARNELLGFDLDEQEKQRMDADAKQANKEEWKQIGSLISKEITSGLNKAWDGLKKVFSDAWKELDTILNFSKLSNTTTRNLRFSYGFSSSQAYGFTQAKNMLGIENDEDLMYMNQQERSQFMNAFTKYTEKYDKLYDSGFFSTLQDYQVEMAELKEDVKLEVVQFFMNNKDTIKTALKALITMSEAVIKGLSWIVSKMGGNNVASASDIVNSYSNKSVTVKVDNTFNGVAKDTSTQIENYMKNTFIQTVNAMGV